MNDQLAGKVAIITGASSGIGEATARAFGDAGARVVLAARREQRLQELADEVNRDGSKAIAVPTDVTDKEAVQRLVDKTLEVFARVDILVNNAGIMPLSLLRKARVEEWDRMVDVNIKGVLYGIAAVLPIMLKQRSGHIVNIGSLAGRRPFPAGTIYSATKFAVRSISAGLRLELSPNDHIRVTDIEPGVVATELTNSIEDPEVRKSFSERWDDRLPLSAEDVARAILYAVTQPEHVNVNEILLRPTEQET